MTLIIRTCLLLGKAPTCKVLFRHKLQRELRVGLMSKKHLLTLVQKTVMAKKPATQRQPSDDQTGSGNLLKDSLMQPPCCVSKPHKIPPNGKQQMRSSLLPLSVLTTQFLRWDQRISLHTQSPMILTLSLTERPWLLQTKINSWSPWVKN